MDIPSVVFRLGSRDPRRSVAIQIGSKRHKTVLKAFHNDRYTLFVAESTLLDRANYRSSIFFHIEGRTFYD